MKNGLFKLGLNDVADSAANAVFAAVILSLAGVVGTAGFDVFAADWGMIFHLAVNSAFVAFVGSLGKAFMSTNDGAVFGAIPTKK